MSKKVEFEFVCKKCKKKLEPKSINDNWAEAPTICPYCGGEVDMKIKG